MVVSGAATVSMNSSKTALVSVGITRKCEINRVRIGAFICIFDKWSLSTLSLMSISPFTTSRRIFCNSSSPLICTIPKDGVFLASSRKKLLYGSGASILLLCTHASISRSTKPMLYNCFPSVKKRVLCILHSTSASLKLVFHLDCLVLPH